MTIGHSTLPLASFLRALHENGCRTLIDVRRYPGSRRYPQYSQEALFASLADEGIGGVWREGLGGRRVVRKDSVNLGWRNASFRGYADYMQTPAFAGELEWLAGVAESETVAIMCAEAVPWRCHRSMIADALLARGLVVDDIFVQADGRSHRDMHAITGFARVESGRVWYPGPEEACGQLFP